MDEALKITADVAAALSYAHRAGVIHRDIKPANIMLHEGEAIVADFGIALALQVAGGDRLTQTGFAVGTPAYMSPEQAAADRELDARSDVYALAAVLYEMLVGEPPHRGATAQAIVAKVLSERPTKISVVRHVPRHVEEAVTKALAKVPMDRFSSCAEFASALTVARPRQVSWQWTIKKVLASPARVGAVAAVIVLGVIVALLVTGDGTGFSPDTVPITRQITFSGRVTDVSLAPDGQMIAYLTENRRTLVVQDIAGEHEVRLVEAEVPLGPPRWSADGTSVVFAADLAGRNGLYSVPRLGGDPSLVVELTMLRAGAARSRRDPGRSPGPAGRLGLGGYDVLLDGRYVVACCGGRVFVGTESSRILVAGPDSFAVEEGAFFDLRREVLQVADLSVSPDGRWYVFLGPSQERQMVLGIGSTDNPDTRLLTELEGVDAGENAGQLGAVRWPAPGDEVVVSYRSGQRSNLLGIRADLRQGTLSGETRVLSSALPAGVSFDISLERDRLVYAGGPSRAQLMLLEVGEQREVSSSRRLTEGTWLHSRPSLSPDGNSVAYVKGSGTEWDVYRRSIDGGPEERLTRTGRTVGALAWSPDGTRLAYPAETGDGVFLMLTELNTGASTQIGSRPMMLTSVPRWSPDGTTLLYAALPDSTKGPGAGRERGVRRSLAVELDVGEGIESDFTPHGFPGLVAAPIYSPDGRSIVTLGGGSRELPGNRLGMWRVPLDDGTPQLLTEGVAVPLAWSADDRIYFLRDPFAGSGVTQIESLPAAGGTPEPHVQLPFGCAASDITISRDGRLVVCAVSEVESDVSVVENLGLRER